MDKERKYRKILDFILENLPCDFVVVTATCDFFGREGTERCRSCSIRDKINTLLEEINDK